MIAHDKATARNDQLDYREIHALSQTHGIETNLDKNATLSSVVNAYHRECALFSTERIIEKIEHFAAENNKKVLYVLSYPAGYLARVHEEQCRWDQGIIDYIRAKRLPMVDLGKAHLDEFSQFSPGMKDYLERYFIGHYNPLGNMFCARAILGELVAMMDPRPVPYHQGTKLGSIGN